MTVKAILTDMDGTFTKFNLDYIGMRRAALKLLDEVGLMRPNFSDQLTIYAMLTELRGTVSTDRLNEIKKRIYAMVETIEIEAAEHVQYARRQRGLERTEADEEENSRGDE